MRRERLRLARSLATGILATAIGLGTLLARPASAGAEPQGVGLSRLRFVDPSRSTKAVAAFPGTPDRRIDVLIWYPAPSAGPDPVENVPLADGGPRPLVVYSHGTYGAPDDASHIAIHLARRGYLVAAPAFPLTSRASFAGLPSAEISDAGNQPRDVSFVIDQLLAHPRFGAAIDPTRIGSTGISLGAVTSYFLSYGRQTRDPRIIANAMIATADPAYAALSFGLGFDGTLHADVRVPALIFAGTRDVFDSTTGGPYAYYARLRSPKYHVMIEGAPHVWFGDGRRVPPDGKNPDCRFFEENAPGLELPLCDERGGLIDPDRQKEIVRAVLTTFFDAHLAGDEKARARLRRTSQLHPEVKLVFEE
jgi:predicted dienelactone hydrolase